MAVGDLLRNKFGLLIGRNAPIVLLTIFLIDIILRVLGSLAPLTLTLCTVHRLLVFLIHFLASWAISSAITTSKLIHAISCMSRFPLNKRCLMEVVTRMVEDLRRRWSRAASIDLTLRQLRCLGMKLTLLYIKLRLI